MTAKDLVHMVNSVSLAVGQAVVKRAIDTKTGLVVQGKNGKPKKISYKRLMKK